MKTLKLRGSALELALEIKAGIDADNNAMEELREQHQAVAEAGHLRVTAQRDRMRALMELGEDACVHLDFTYLEEHGDMYLRTGCEHPADLLPVEGRLQ